MADTVYYGEQDCQTCKSRGLNKINKAYYLCNDLYVYGVHSRGKEKERVTLKKNPDSALIKERLLKKRKRLVLAQAKKNKEKGIAGKVICAKMRMMREPPHIDGYYKVFPNFKHQNRCDGYGCKNLSPKAMGPVVHGQSGLPDAMSIENFHQGN